MIAGDHAHLDAGAVSLGDGGAGLGPRGVNDAHQGKEGKILQLIQQVSPGIEGFRVVVLAGKAQHAHALRGYAVVLADRHLADKVVHGDDRTLRCEGLGGAGQERVGGTLDVGAHHRLALLIGHVVEGGHHLVVGVERQFGDARELLAGSLDVDAPLLDQHDQRPLGGVADELAIIEHRVGVQRHSDQGRPEVDVAGLADNADLAGGAIAFTRYGKAVAGHTQLARGHLVERQGAGLVGADGGGRAQGLGGGQTLDDSVGRG